MKSRQLELIKQDCARSILGSYKRANAGHIGASLSCLDILVFLFFQKMATEDRFVLSKGHAALALYTVLAKAGHLDPKRLDEFYADGTLLAAHPPCNGQIEKIPFGTGSLGHGLSLACGMALADRFTDTRRRVYCVVSEGDLNEGSTWEAILFGAHHRLSELVVLVDRNGLQGFGTSEDVLSLGDLEQKFRSFQFDVATADNGNDFESLERAFQSLDVSSSRPKCIIANTTKGKGVSYMENQMEWHYLPMSDLQYQQAMAELEGSGA